MDNFSKTLLRLPMQYFAEPPAEPPAPQDTPPPEPAQVNYEELMATDKGLQSFVDRYATKSAQTAVQNALQKQQRLTDEKLSESERLQVMTAEEKAKYFENKFKQAEQARQHDRETDGLKSQTAAMLKGGGVPDAFLSLFDFSNATAEDVKQRVEALSEYEYYKKGEFDTRVTAAVDEKLRIKPPESHQPPESDPFMQGFNTKL